jgi:hypothetical protein
VRYVGVSIDQGDLAERRVVSQLNIDAGSFDLTLEPSVLRRLYMLGTPSFR